MTRPSMKNWYILFTSKVICIQELNTFFGGGGGETRETKPGLFFYVGNNKKTPKKHNTYIFSGDMLLQ